MQTKLKGVVKQRIKDSQELQLKIAKALNKRNIVTVQRWVKNDSHLLTLPDVQEIISQHLGLPKEDLVVLADAPPAFAA